MENLKLDIDRPFKISDDQIKRFRNNGFIKLKKALSKEVIDHYGKLITDKVIELNTLHIPMEKRNTYQKAFLQIANIWQKDRSVKEFVLSKRLAKIATDLLGTEGVRLYHDQALYKEGGGGITPWHTDQFYWPLSSNNSVTAWIPLQETSVDMGPLSFAAESHNFKFGRDLPIGDESEKIIDEALRNNSFKFIEEPFELGEVSFHYGWTFHKAGQNISDKPRRVMTIIYIDKNMKLAEPINSNQVKDMNVWCPGVKVGEIINSDLNPILFSY